MDNNILLPCTTNLLVDAYDPINGSGCRHKLEDQKKKSPLKWRVQEVLTLSKVERVREIFA